MGLELTNPVLKDLDSDSKVKIWIRTPLIVSYPYSSYWIGTGIVESINVDISTRLFSSPILVMTYLLNLFFVNVPCCHKLLGSLLLQNEWVYTMFEKFIYKQTCFRIRRAYHRLQLLSDNLMSFSSTIDFITE